LPQTCSRCYCWANVGSTDGVRTPGHLNFSPFGEAYVDDESPEQILKRIENAPSWLIKREQKDALTDWWKTASSEERNNFIKQVKANPESHGTGILIDSINQRPELVQAPTPKQDLQQLVRLMALSAKLHEQLDALWAMKGHVRLVYIIGDPAGAIGIITREDGTKVLWKFKVEVKQDQDLNMVGKTVTPVGEIGSYGRMTDDEIIAAHRVRQGIGPKTAIEIVYDAIDYAPLLGTAKSLDNAIRLWKSDPAAAKRELLSAGISFVGDAMFVSPLIFKLANKLATIGTVRLLTPGAVASAKATIAAVEAATRAFCFAKGTRLVTPMGLKAIEDFGIGDPIFSADENDPSCQVQIGYVSDVFERSTLVTRICLAGREFCLTPDHPVFILDRGWIQAGELIQGDRVLGHNKITVPIDRIEEDRQLRTVYNLTIDRFHTFFVSGDNWGFSVWVHNSALCDAVKKLGEVLTSATATQTEKTAARNEVKKLLLTASREDLAQTVGKPGAWENLATLLDAEGKEILSEVAPKIPYTKSPKPDPAADALANKIGGESRVIVDGVEFDAISSEYVAQSSSSAIVATKPGNWLSKQHKDQIKATLELAKKYDRSAYFEFTKAAPDQTIRVYFGEGSGDWFGC